MQSVKEKTRKPRPSRPLPKRRRPDQDLVDLIILDFPLKLKRALAKQAKREGSNMTNVAVAALAKEFRVAFHPTDRLNNSAGDSGKVSFSMPRRLRIAISVYAANNETTQKAVVIDILTRSFLAR